MNPNEIKDLRAHFRWTQARLAEEVGVTRSTVAKWERGERVPGGSAEMLLRKLSAYLKPEKRQGPLPQFRGRHEEEE